MDKTRRRCRVQIYRLREDGSWPDVFVAFLDIAEDPPPRRRLVVFAVDGSLAGLRSTALRSATTNVSTRDRDRRKTRRGNGVGSLTRQMPKDSASRPGPRAASEQASAGVDRRTRR